MPSKTLGRLRGETGVVSGRLSTHSTVSHPGRPDNRRFRDGSLRDRAMAQMESPRGGLSMGLTISPATQLLINDHQSEN